MQEPNQQPDVAWALPERAALTLRADRAQLLWVHAGRVWLTRRCRRGQAADVWLGPGERCLLPAGSEWVAEAAPSARVSLVLAAQRVPSGRARVPWLTWIWSAWRAWPRAAALSA
jgi:hypothetical protein